MGKTEVMVAQNRGDGEDQLKRWLTKVVVVVACVAIVMKGFDQI